MPWYYLTPIPIDSCSLVAGRYQYTSELLALEQVGSASASPQPVAIQGFLPLDRWAPYLNLHPHQMFTTFIRRGIQCGFRVGFDRNHKLKSCSSNHQSVYENTSVVDAYIAREVSQGKLAVASRGEVSHYWAKPRQPGKYRLVVDLLSLQGFSINDGIASELCSLHCLSVEQAVELVKLCGPGALMAKIDLHSAYRMVPVDQSLLCIEWKGNWYMDKALPFGLRSAPILFTAVADALAWAMICN